MDAESEVQHRGTGRQDAEFAGRREDKDLAGRRLGKVFRGIGARMLQGITHAPQPGVQRLFPFDALIGPVGGKAVLGHIVHALGADLHLHIGSVAVFDRDVQAFVTVGLGIGDPVAQTPGVRFVLLRHKGIDLPAEVFLLLVVFPVAVDDEADGKDIVHALERHFLLLHLLPDGVGGLGTDFQFVADAGLGEFQLERLDEFGHQFFAVLLPGFQFVGDEPVLFRLGIIQVDVLHLPLHVVQAQLVRQGDVQHEGFQNFLVPVGFRKHLQVPHHLQAVGQFENRYARVTRVLNDQFLVILRLQPGVLGLDGGNFVESVHEGAHRLSPLAGLYHIVSHAAGFMQVNGHDAFFGKADLVGHDAGHRVRMADEGRSVIAGAVFQDGGGRFTGPGYETTFFHVGVRSGQFGKRAHSQGARCKWRRSDAYR